MRKIALVFACLAASVATSFAQEAGDASLGVNLNYASESAFGIGTKFQYNLTQSIRIEPEFNYYFKHDCTHFWDAGVNFSYLIPVARDVVVYPLAGIGYMQGREIGLDYSEPGVDVDTTFGTFQAKIGVGAEFQLTPKAKLLIEPKYQFCDFDDIYSGFKNQFVLTAGIAYCF